MKKFLADTFAMITFTAVVGMGVEIFLAKMTLLQSLHARVASAPVNLVTARPYGIFRDWVYKITKVSEGGAIRRALADIVAFVLFQMPVYAFILFLSGATLPQIAKACSAGVFITAFVGWPYGLYLDFCRKLFRLKKRSLGTN